MRALNAIFIYIELSDTLFRCVSINQKNLLEQQFSFKISEKIQLKEKRNEMSFNRNYKEKLKLIEKK